MESTPKTAWRRQAILSRIHRALDAFMTLQKVDWDYDVRQTLDEILAVAAKELNFGGDKEIERALLLVLSAEGGPLEVRAGYQAGEDLTFSHTIVEETLRTGEPVLSPNACQDPRFRDAESIRDLKVLSCIAVPLKTDTEVLGAVYVEGRSPRSIFQKSDQEFLEEFARAITPYVKTAVTHERHVREIRKLQDEVASRFGFQNIIGRSVAMQAVFELARVAARGDQTVLITGESGSGKELLARAIHYNSARRNRPFLIVDCSALSESLLESELFGHKKGAFTGATSDKIGAFEEADGGTVFLDEICDASKALQQKLRRVIQEGEIRPVGSATFKRVNVRVIAATNKDLRKEVEENRFLRDLYFRINRFPIHIPPLRERPEDIPLLANHFLKQTSQRRNPPVVSIEPAAMDFLVAQSWEENNVRELKNAIELACDLAPGTTIDLATIQRVRELLGSRSGVSSKSPEPSRAYPHQLVSINEEALGRLLSTNTEERPFRIVETQFMGRVIVSALRRTNWKLRPAARLLGISPGKLREGLKQYLSWIKKQTENEKSAANLAGMPHNVFMKKTKDLGLQ